MRIFKILIIFYSENVPFPVFHIFNNVVIIYSAIQFTNFKMLCLVRWLLMVLVNFWSLTMLLPKASHPRRSLWILLLKYLSNLLIATFLTLEGDKELTDSPGFSFLIPFTQQPKTSNRSFAFFVGWCFTCLLVFKHKSLLVLWWFLKVPNITKYIK